MQLEVVDRMQRHAKGGLRAVFLKLTGDGSSNDTAAMPTDTSEVRNR